ncbi:hypothetical protein [Enterobacter bugandensis]|uniref:hypothetical protein n=1 Tax=Enterobacter bugandensis TaxID=881260 RepID=UPI001C12BA13|nr:hypothetical protein [Enterobacter bugandensis]
MISRYPEHEYISPNHNHEKKLANWNNKVSVGKQGKFSSGPTKFISSDLLLENIKRYCIKNNIDSFSPRDFRRTFKTLAGQIKITKEIRDRIQHHALHDVSSIHYDRYDYNEEKLEALLKWENKLKEIMKK